MPDSIFGNNWISTHKNNDFPDGLLIVYKMKTSNRAEEINEDIINDLRKNYKNFIDLRNQEHP